jgi:putative endopeptidase
MPLLGSLHRMGINPFFGIYSMQNPGDATHMIGVADQSGLGLPEKGYYFDEENQKIRQQYLAHIKNTLSLYGIRDAEKVAKQAYSVELKIAKFSLSALDQQDPVKTYNPIGKKALQKLTPDLDWNQYFAAIHFDSADRLDVVSPAYFKSLSSLIKKSTLSDLKDYLTWLVLKETSRFSTAAIQQEHFNFYNKTLNGTKDRQPQWKTCIATVDNSLGEALGQAFIEVAFGQESKDLADQMVLNVKTSLKEVVTKLDWMDDETKEGAFKKIAKLNQKIGFPKKFKSYSDLEVTNDSWFKNQLSSNAFSFDETIKKANLAVDRDTWGMTPPTDNAYYDATMNEIVFPAGILQAPLFNVHSSVAANYGATGATIGHEMTHGFDDSGSQYDEFGNLKNWWSEESAKVFKEKGQCLINQYSGYTTEDGTHLDGQLSIGENIADLGGLKIALAAFMKTHANIDNSEFKTFFLAYAQSWCGKYTDEAARTAINTDTHSLPKFRVNGVVSNLPEFEEVFQCKSGEAMAPKNRCSVW